jgi:hypothetical protein
VDADDVVGLLADPDRLRVAAVVIIEPADTERVATLAGLPGRTVIVALRRLEAGGLVARDDRGRWWFRSDEIRQVARVARPAQRRNAQTPAEAVLETFIVDGRLTHLPATRAKRLVVLDRLATEFEPGQRYDEKQVNDLLRHWHDDVASLRRYLVDEGFLSRDHGRYWRTGGTVDVAD